MNEHDRNAIRFQGLLQLLPSARGQLDGRGDVPRMTLTPSVPNVSNLLYPHGNPSVGGRLDIRHVANVTKSWKFK